MSIGFGHMVRAKCGATGRALGGGRNLVLYVSAQDNDLGIDEANYDEPPWLESPLPSLEACMAANVGISFGLRASP